MNGGSVSNKNILKKIEKNLVDSNFSQFFRCRYSGKEIYRRIHTANYNSPQISKPSFGDLYNELLIKVKNGVNHYNGIAMLYPLIKM